MNLQRRFLNGAVTISWTICLLFLTLTLAVPAQAAPQPAVNQSASLQLPPSARVAVRRIFAWAGPGRGFWALGLLSAGEVVPVTGISADRQWWQVNTQFGVAYVWYLDVTTENVAGIPVVDPGVIGRITAGRVIIRGGPGIESRAVGSASRGMQFYVLGARPDGLWLQIKYRFGTGWVSTSLTSVANAVVPAASGEPRFIVNAGPLNVLTGPGFIFKSLGTVRGGTTMKIIGKSNDGIWLQVESPFGKG